MGGTVLSDPSCQSGASRLLFSHVQHGFSFKSGWEWWFKCICQRLGGGGVRPLAACIAVVATVSAPGPPPTSLDACLTAVSMVSARFVGSWMHRQLRYRLSTTFMQA